MERESEDKKCEGEVRAGGNEDDEREDVRLA